MPRRRGFTLVELLIVIAIIALLIALLLPAIKQARELGKRAACASNLHQLVVAVSAYASDHGGQFPEGGRSTAWVYFTDMYGTGWRESLWPQYVPLPALCYCPSSKLADYRHPVDGLWWHVSRSEDRGAIIGYFYMPNQATTRRDDFGNEFPNTLEQGTSQNVLMADESSYFPEWLTPHNWNHLLDEPQGGNTFYGDGHGAWVSYLGDENTNEGGQLPRVRCGPGGSLVHYW